MATQNTNPSDNGRGPGPSIVATPILENHGVSMAKFIAVWCLSAFINVSLVIVGAVLFAMITPRLNADVTDIDAPVEVEDVEKQPDLSNEDIGLDDTLKTNYNVDRLEEVSVPGRVDPNAPVGIINAPEAAPSNVPPPPGSGGGTGGAPMMAESGIGSAAGTIGGMGGMYNIGGFNGRSAATREKMLNEGGGNKLSEAAVARGLKWLAHHQAQDGHWSLNEFNKHARTAPWPGGKIEPDNCVANTNRRNDVAGTAFGLLPFLAAGQTHKPATKPVIDYSKGIGQALKWLVNQQDKTSGRNKGFYGGDMYSHGLATIAMCEAYGMTSDNALKPSAQAALNYIAAAQDSAGGGWRYSFGSPGDTSVTGWQLMALKSGQMAGLTVPKGTLRKVEKYLDACESSDPNNSSQRTGGYGYMPGNPPTPAMTAVGLLCRQYLGVNPRNPGLQSGIKMLKKFPPGKTTNLYYEYYATQVMHHMGGEDWNFWNLGEDGSGKAGIRDILMARQDKGAGARVAQAGSWDGQDGVGGRIGATSLALLSLEVYYRHLPLYRRDLGVMKDK